MSSIEYITNIYAYPTGRTDGMAVCVGVMYADDRTPTLDGMHALFRDMPSAIVYMEALAANTGATIMGTPSLGYEPTQARPVASEPTAVEG